MNWLFVNEVIYVKIPFELLILTLVIFFLLFSYKQYEYVEIISKRYFRNVSPIVTKNYVGLFAVPCGSRSCFYFVIMWTACDSLIA